MFLRSLVLIALILLGTIGEASAQDVTAWQCEGCTAQQMKNLAQSKGAGPQYIYSLSGGVLAAYQVEMLDLPGGWTPKAFNAQPEDWMLDQFAVILDFYEANGNSTHGMASVNASSSGESINAYSVVNSSQDRNTIATALTNNQSVRAFSVLISAARLVRLSNIATPNLPLTVTTNFPDGSKAIFQFNWDTKKWEYVSGSAVDSHGNKVPETADDFSNNGVGATYNFSGPGNPNDINDFIQRAHMAGVSIGNGIAWVCVGSGSGVHCNPQ